MFRTEFFFTSCGHSKTQMAETDIAFRRQKVPDFQQNLLISPEVANGDHTEQMLQNLVHAKCHPVSEKNYQNCMS